VRSREQLQGKSGSKSTWFLTYVVLLKYAALLKLSLPLLFELRENAVAFPFVSKFSPKVLIPGSEFGVKRYTGLRNDSKLKPLFDEI
jgi:hypothetical protein